VAWNGAGGWLIFSQSRQVNFSRIVWITFQVRGTSSSVSVMSSPIFTSRAEPQQVQAPGGSITTRSRGRCPGKGLRTGRRRSKAATGVVRAAARPAAISSTVALASSSSSCSSNCSISCARRSELRPYCSRRSLAISSRRCAIIASEVETTARASANSASAVRARASEAASRARRRVISAAMSDMAKATTKDR